MDEKWLRYEQIIQRTLFCSYLSHFSSFRLFLVSFWWVNLLGRGYGCARVRVRVGVELPMGYPWCALYILSKLVLDVHTISYLWYLHGFLQETMCTTYTPPVVQPVFLPLWFLTGNHMHYIPHYTWDPHDPHACPSRIPLFKPRPLDQ